MQRTIVEIEEISISFHEAERWDDYVEKFKEIVVYLEAKESKNNYISCEIAFNYGKTLNTMFNHYKLEKFEENWKNYNNIKMCVRTEIYYRQFYNYLEGYQKIKYCGLPFFKLRDQINYIKNALKLHPDMATYFKE